MSIANMKNDLADTQGSLEEDKKFLAELEQGCGTKQAEWDERQKTRSEELLALAGAPAGGSCDIAGGAALVASRDYLFASGLGGGKSHPGAE